jgi:hypothetical protein
MTRANLFGATTNENTLWPAGIDWSTAGVIFD